MDKNNSNTENETSLKTGPGNSDLPDSMKDIEKMRTEPTTMDLPDVKDIPGQEFVHPMPIGEMADTTISSDDEEGVGILDLDDDPESEPLISNTNKNVSRAEKKVLQQATEDMPTEDDIHLRAGALDNIDDEGTPLNEKGFTSAGSDLDIAGADEDDADEEIGEEDEENNEYSLGADKD